MGCGILLPVTLAAALESGVAAGDPRLEALALLHDGRFEDAEEAIRRGRSEAATDPSLAFFRAFVTYWRLLYAPADPGLRAELEERLDAAVRLAEERLQSDPADREAALWAGSSGLLRAHLRAAKRKPLAAAFEARRAKRYLDRAEERGPWAADAAFGLGTYLYVADRVPAIVKGLRTVLFLPGGDRERGLALLRRAAEASRFFARDARLLLITLYAHPSERMYAEALREADRALAPAPAPVAALHLAGKLNLALGRLDAAAALLARAFERTGAAGRTAPSVLAAIEVDRAAVDFARFRPDLAIERLDERVLGRPGVPEELRRSAEQVRAAAVEIAGERGSRPVTETTPDGVPRAASWRRALPALEIERREGAAASLPRLLALAEAAPDDATLALLAGRALFLSGRFSEAIRMLRCSEREAAIPPFWIGPCHLMEGQAADLAGDRKAALLHYRKAEQAPPFPSRDATRMYQKIPYGGER